MGAFGPSRMPGIMAPGMSRGPIQQMPMNGQMNPNVNSNSMQNGMAGPSGNWMQQIMQMFNQGQNTNQPSKSIFESMRF